MDPLNNLREIAYTSQSEGYRLLLFSSVDQSRPHFARAARALTKLNRIYSKDIRPIDEQARTDLEIARMYWRAADERSLAHFEYALEAYGFGQMMQNPQVKLRSVYGSAYIRLFLEEFDLARREAKLAYQLERQSGMFVLAPLGNLYGELSFYCDRKDVSGLEKNVDMVHDFIQGNRDTLPQRELLQLLDLQDFFKWRLSHMAAM